ncbi:MAG: hypothetical protein ACK55I_36500, partial [bacterium]
MDDQLTSAWACSEASPVIIIRKYCQQRHPVLCSGWWNLRRSGKQQSHNRAAARPARVSGLVRRSPFGTKSIP